VVLVPVLTHFLLGLIVLTHFLLEHILIFLFQHFDSLCLLAFSPLQVLRMAGLGKDLVQVFATGLPLHWELLRLWTGFELPSSWSALPAYGAHRNRNILDFMRWPQTDLGAQDLNDIQRPKSFQTNSWK
jgi:hypothetical protein